MVTGPKPSQIQGKDPFCPCPDLIHRFACLEFVYLLDILKDIKSQVNERLEVVNMKKMIPVVRHRSGA
jgi:hypothetical protein